jgi:capsule polysaccharide export protein KpsE/RkpR
VSAQNSLLAGNLMLAQAQAIMNQTNSQIMGMQNSVNNFDHGVLRGDTPVYAQGQSQPLFWVGH